MRCNACSRDFIASFEPRLRPPTSPSLTDPHLSFTPQFPELPARRALLAAHVLSSLLLGAAVFHAGTAPVYHPSSRVRYSSTLQVSEPQSRPDPRAGTRCIHGQSLTRQHALTLSHTQLTG
jgi:hypothetical protein